MNVLASDLMSDPGDAALKAVMVRFQQAEYDALRAVAASSDVPMTRLIRRAVREMIARMRGREESAPKGRTTKETP